MRSEAILDVLKIGNGVYGTVFDLKNECLFTAWPATVTGSGGAIKGGGGFSLPSGASTKIQATPNWLGRIWARTGCNFDGPNIKPYTTGDCPGGVKCTGGGQPPVTLSEFTLGSNSTAKDFYDVSLVDGYNVGIGIRTTGQEQGTVATRAVYRTLTEAVQMIFR